MASSHFPGQSEHDFAQSANDTSSAPPLPQVYAYMLETNQPPSPNDISAATILATLSDGRPPTSQGDYEPEFEDEDQGGGISLLDENMSPSHAITTTSGNLHFYSEVISPSDSLSSIGMDYTSYASLDQHAAALASLSMEQLPTPPASTAPLSVPEVLSTPAPNSGYVLVPMVNNYEGHLNVQDTNAFLDIDLFFDDYAAPPKVLAPGLDLHSMPESITRDELSGDRCDYQGIDWSSRHTSRVEIRTKRVACEHARMPPRMRDIRKWHVQTPNTDNFFSFRRMNTMHRAIYPHFQLRNLLATTSRNDIYYATKWSVMRTDASGTPANTVMDLTKRTTDGQLFHITSLAASDNVLIAGGFEGEYAITDLSSTYGSPYTFDRIRNWAPDTKSRITNHLHLFDSRHTYVPQAVLCSNDNHLRILDCATNTFTYTFGYSAAVNCSATSPNGRMRVVVGDFQETLITNAETGQPFETLTSHTDDAFACAWADDGIHIATAAQDSTIVVWDARYWKQPLNVLYSELAVPRSLRFSPVGSGPRVLVSAEADDYVAIYNAQTFESKQVFDFFGALAGTSMTPDGQSLFIANSDPRFGGIIELERTGWAENTSTRGRSHSAQRDDMVADWAYDSDIDNDTRVLCGSQERSRRGLDLAELVI